MKILSNKYLLSTIALVFFSLTTVVLFLLALGRRLVDIVGSVEIAFAIVIVNIIILSVSIVAHVWHKAHRDTPKRIASDILQKYAEAEAIKEQNEKTPPR